MPFKSDTRLKPGNGRDEVLVLACGNLTCDDKDAFDTSAASATVLSETRVLSFARYHLVIFRESNPPLQTTTIDLLCVLVCDASTTRPMAGTTIIGEHPSIRTWPYLLETSLPAVSPWITGMRLLRWTSKDRHHVFLPSPPLLRSFPCQVVQPPIQHVMFLLL